MRRGKRLLKYGASGGAALLVLLAGAFLYVNRGGFITAHVLPRVGRQLGEPVTAGGASFSVFGRLELRDLRVGAAPPWLTVKLLRVRYRLGDLFHGRLTVDEVTVDGVAADVSNHRLTQLAARLAAPPKVAPPAPPAAAGAARPAWQLNVRNVRLSGINVRYCQLDAAGRELAAAGVRQLEATLPVLSNGGAFNLAVAGQAFVETGADAARVEALRVTVDGTLDEALQPVSLKLGASADELQGRVAGVPLTGRAMTIEGAVKREGQGFALSGVRLVATGGPATEAVVAVAGQVQRDGAADLTLDVNLPNASLLQAIGQRLPQLGLDLKSLNYRCRAQLGAGAREVRLDGDLAVDQFVAWQRATPAQRPEPVTVRAAHRVALDRSALRLKLDALEARVASPTAELFRLTLSNPVELDLRQPQAVQAALELHANVNHAVVRPLLPVLPGVVIRNWALRTEKVALTVSGTGDAFAATLGGAVVVDQLDVTVNGARLADLETRLAFAVQAAGLKAVTVGGATRLAGTVTARDTFVTVRRTGQATAELVRLDLSGNADLAAGSGAGRLTVKAPALGELAPLLPPNLGVVGLAGTLELSLAAALEQWGQVVNAQGELVVAGLAVAATGATAAAPVNVRAGYDLGYGDAGLVTVRRAAGSVTTAAGEAVADFQASGTVEMNRQRGRDARLKLSVPRLDLARLQPLLPPGLGVGRLAGLVTVEVNTAQGPATLLAAQGQVRIRGLDVAWGQNAALARPVDADVDFDGQLGRDESLELRQASVKVTAGQVLALIEAKGALSFKPDAQPTGLVLRVPALDLAGLRPLLPPSLGIEALAGQFAGELTVKPGPKALGATGAWTVTGLDVALAGAGKLAAPLTATVGLDASYALADRAGMLDLKRLDLAVAAVGGKPLATAAIDGVVDAALAGRLSEVTIRVPQAVDLERLAALWVARPKGQGDPAAATSADPPPRTKSGLERLWLVLHLRVNQADYGALRIADLKANATLKDNRVTVRDTALTLNGGPVTVEADADLKQLDNLEYHGRVQVERLPVEPLLKTFRGVDQVLPVDVGGEIRRVDATFKGHGLTVEQAVPHLTADASLDLGTLRVVRLRGRLPADNPLNDEELAKLLFGLVSGKKSQRLTFSETLGTALQLVLFKAKVPVARLGFERGQGRVHVADGMLALTGLRLTSPDLEIATTARVRLLGDWRTELNLVPTFAAATGARLKGIQLERLDDGRYRAPTIAYAGEPLDTKSYVPFLLKVVASYYEKTGKYLKYLGQGGDATQDLKTLFGGDGDKTEAAKDLGKGLLDLGKTILEERAKDKAPPAEPAPDKPKKKKKPAPQPPAP